MSKDDVRLSVLSSWGNTNSGSCIQVKGDVVAHVASTCVRTNEDFDVELLEFSIFSIVRASEMREATKQDAELGRMSLAQIEGQLGGGGGGKKKKGELNFANRADKIIFIMH